MKNPWAVEDMPRGILLDTHRLWVTDAAGIIAALDQLLPGAGESLPVGGLDLFHTVAGGVVEFAAAGVEHIIPDLRISGGIGRWFRRRCRWQWGGRNRGWTEGNNGGLRDRGGAA